MKTSPPSSFKELLSRYANGERDFSDAELDKDKENDLSGVHLDGIDLSRAFVMATFGGASLKGAVFHEANVKTCDFSGADLRDADFRGALLCSAEFIDARLDGAQFEGAYIHSYKFLAGERPDIPPQQQRP